MVRALASHQCSPGSIPGHGVMWVEFVVGSHPCFEGQHHATSLIQQNFEFAN